MSSHSSDQQELEDLRYALDQAAIVAVTDQKGVIKYVNDTFCEISKYSREELIGQDHRILNSSYHPTSMIRSLWRTIGQGNVWRGELRNRAKDGSIYWVDTTIVPFLGEDRKPYKYLAIRHDITERMAVQARLARQESLAELGQMAATIAHEVKNPLAGISGALQIIGRRLPPGSSEVAIVAQAQERIESLSESLSALLAFARPNATHRDEVHVAELIDSTAMLLESDERFDDVTVHTTHCDCVIDGDVHKLREAVLNLAINASAALKGSGNVWIAGERHGKSCSIVVADDGPGIPEDLREKVFQPFFTTSVQGVGLGLATVRRTAEQHDGSVEVEAPPKGGARFRISLPIMNKSQV